MSGTVTGIRSCWKSQMPLHSKASLHLARLLPPLGPKPPSTTTQIQSHPFCSHLEQTDKYKHVTWPWRSAQLWASWPSKSSQDPSSTLTGFLVLEGDRVSQGSRERAQATSIFWDYQYICYKIKKCPNRVTELVIYFKYLHCKINPFNPKV